MLVSDISERSLAKAKRLLETHGLSARARFVVADGLDALDAADTPVSALAILGMGGASIAGILLRGRQKLAGAKLILSAHTDLFALRKAVYDIGYHLAREAIAVAGSRRYIVMLAETGERAVGDRELYIGPCLLRDRPEGFDDYLAWRERVISREWEPGERLQWIREAIGHATGDGSGHL